MNGRAAGSSSAANSDKSGQLGASGCQLPSSFDWSSYRAATTPRDQGKICRSVWHSVLRRGGGEGEGGRENGQWHCVLGDKEGWQKQTNNMCFAHTALHRLGSGLPVPLQLLLCFQTNLLGPSLQRLME